MGWRWSRRLAQEPGTSAAGAAADAPGSSFTVPLTLSLSKGERVYARVEHDMLTPGEESAARPELVEGRAVRLYGFLGLNAPVTLSTFSAASCTLRFSWVAPISAVRSWAVASACSTAVAVPAR